MKILARNKRKKEIKLLPESQDDLWCLRNLIEEDDRISSIIYRERKILPSDKLRAKKAEKKAMKAILRIIKVEFQEFSDRMRIFGVIEEAPQDLGKHHTLNLDVQQPLALTLIKEEWKDSHLRLLKDAIERSKLPLVMIIALDEEEATLACLRSYGIQLVGVVNSHRSGKQYPSPPGYEQKYYASIIQKISQLKEASSPLLIVGPGFAKEKLLNRTKEKRPELFNNYSVRATGERGIPGIQEAIKKGFVAQIQKKSRISLETSLVEELLVEIAKDRYAAYGYVATKEAIEKGAGRILLVASDLLHEERIQDLMEIASKIGCKIHLISTFHEGGMKLIALGGIGAILRY
jgi:protein pelota